MFDDVVRYDLDGHAHIFVAVHWGSEVKQLDIGSDIPGIQSADDTVPHDF